MVVESFSPSAIRPHIRGNPLFRHRQNARNHTVTKIDIFEKLSLEHISKLENKHEDSPQESNTIKCVQKRGIAKEK